MNRRNVQGFTLMEMLVVIAIIAVLVAIAIPVFTSQTAQAREGVDLANERSAYAAALTEWMTSEDEGKQVTYYYDGGEITKDMSGIQGYGQSSVDASEFSGDIDAAVSGVPNLNGKANFLTIRVSSLGAVAMSWANALGDWSLLTGTTVPSSEKDGLWYSSNDSDKAKKQEIYDNVRKQNSNDDRVKADQGILKSLASYFDSLTEDEARAILGSQFDKMKGNGGAVLMNYTIDAAYSVRLNPDAATNNASYLSAIGYAPRVYVTETNADSSKNWREEKGYYTTNGNNYVNKYLFTSDEAIGSVGTQKNVKMSFKVENGKLKSTKVWIDGASKLTSVA